MENNNFLMFGNYRKHIEVLSGEQVKELMLMMFDFADGEEPESEDILVTTMFNFMKDNAVVGSKRRITNVENGKKGGRPVKVKETPKKEVKRKEVKEPKEEEVRKPYGTFKRVQLTDNEYSKLFEVYKEQQYVERAIDLLDNYMESSGKTYKRYYAILSGGWVFDKMTQLYKNQKNDLRESSLILDEEFLLGFDIVK